jgi:hypothetical protein
MKNLLFTVAALVVAFNAEARTPAAQKGAGSTASYSAPAASTSTSGRQNILSPSLGWMGPGGTNTLTDGDSKAAKSMQLSGLFDIGAEYEYMLKDDFSIGGFFRYGMTSDSVAGNSVDESVFLIGPMAHAYLINNDRWIAYVGSGFTAISLKHKESVGGTSTTWSPNVALGIPFAIGVAYKFTDTISGGIENMRVMALGSDINGWVTDDMMLRLRLAL